MQDLLADIGVRLASRSYPNEASVREGIVVPVLRQLGWNTADPKQVCPEYSISGAGRADYALLHRSGRPLAIIEVKAVGRSLDGEDQLFRYCYEVGVQLAVMTDGRTWNFYLPGGLGAFGDRRFYSLQLDDRSAEEAQAVLVRYLSRDRVENRSAIEAAWQDHDAAVTRREATSNLPEAWAELVSERNDKLIELIQDKVEAICGFRPDEAATADYLGELRQSAQKGGAVPMAAAPKPAATEFSNAATGKLAIQYNLFGDARSAPNASRALVDILRVIVARDPTRISSLGEAVRSKTMQHIGRTPEEINPRRPDIARAAEIAPGWLVGLNIDNRTKQSIIDAAREIYGLSAAEIDVVLPNS
ncbi:type I restriction endonuclease [Tsuneonella rigui]|uniref:type I restriction endonuclease n=1 Tax=Tsuneonella rigui TaxID=1708790 RepID=UPI000F7F37D7|nr:type I restriction endonuclease [Tsuneonella rigui]